MSSRMNPKVSPQSVSSSSHSLRDHLSLSDQLTGITLTETPCLPVGVTVLKVTNTSTCSGLQMCLPKDLVHDLYLGTSYIQP